MDLDRLRRNWNQLGRVDPFWAILAYPDRKGNRWTLDEFFATGVSQVAEYLAAADVCVPGLRRGRALDFGCGAGRLTQALGSQFQLVDGVDIAESMLALANEHNRAPEQVRFHLNERADLALFPDDTFDFLISIVVLQHMRNSLKRSYVEEFVRVLAPGGVAAFTVPSHADWSLNGVVRRLPNRIQNVYRRRRYGYQAVMEFYTMPRAQVEQAVSGAGGVVLSVTEESMAGPPWVSYLYLVRKPEPGTVWLA